MAFRFSRNSDLGDGGMMRERSLYQTILGANFSTGVPRYPASETLVGISQSANDVNRNPGVSDLIGYEQDRG